MAFKIDKNVPVPKAIYKSKYPFADLKIKDSFFVPGKTPVSFGYMISSAKRRYKHAYLTRAVIEEGKKGIRIWRKK